MKTPVILLALAAVGLTALNAPQAQAGPAGKVMVLDSSATRIVPGSTWAWAPPLASSLDPRIANDLMDDRIRAAVEQALSRKGYRQVDRAHASVLVSYHVGVDKRVDVDTRPGVAAPTVCGLRGCVYGWSVAGPSFDVDPYIEGTLRLDLVDAGTGRLAWQATSRKKVSEKDASPQRLNAVLVDMTKSLPSS